METADAGAGAGAGAGMRARVSEALADKLYISPALDTASWCNETGYSVYLYVHRVLVSGKQFA